MELNTIVPNDWDVKYIGDLTTKVGSGITPTGGAKIYKKEGRFFLRSQNVGWGYLKLEDVAFIDEEVHQTFPSSELKEGDVLLNITGASIGRSAIASKEVVGGNVNQHVCIIRTNDDVNFQYLNAVLLSKIGQNQIDSFQAGGNREGLNFGQIKSIQIPIPTLTEQTAIANALSDADALIAALDDLIEKKRQIKQGTMQQLLTPPHRGGRRLEGFSGEWIKTDLESILRIKGGFAFSSEYFSKKGVILLTPGNFKLKGGLYFTERNTKYYSGSFSSSMYFQKGDLIIVMTDLTPECNLLGKPAFIETDKIILHNQRIGKVEIIKKDISKSFLYYYFLSKPYGQKMKETATGSTVRHTSNKSIYSCKIDIPSLAEQTAIATILSDMDTEIEALEGKRAKYQSIKSGMMQELLTGRVRLV